MVFLVLVTVVFCLQWVVLGYSIGILCCLRQYSVRRIWLFCSGFLFDCRKWKLTQNNLSLKGLFLGISPFSDQSLFFKDKCFALCVPLFTFQVLALIVSAVNCFPLVRLSTASITLLGEYVPSQIMTSSDIAKTTFDLITTA